MMNTYSAGMRLFFRLFIVVASVALVSACSPLFSETFSYDLKPDESDVFNTNKAMDLTILSSVGIRFTDDKGNRVTELSGIVWDDDESLLYAISDEGMLYHFSIVAENGAKSLALDNGIKTLHLVKSLPLLARNGSRLKGKWQDSEGLSSINERNGKKNDTELIISFENKPRVAKYSVDGKFLGDVKLPKKLWRKKNYRSKNKALEAVAIHKKYGVLTAAEYPLKENDKKMQTIYSSRGKEWSFKASAAKNSAITGLEVLENGHVLVLERAWSGIKNALVISLSSIDLDECGGKKICTTKKIVTLSSADGWVLDNFEGLAHYRNNKYFMVSDDNESTLQTTILVLFQINGI